MTTKELSILAAVALTAGLVSTPSAFAQAAPAGGDKAPPAVGRPERRGPMGDPAARLTAELKLTEEQQAKVKAIYEEMNPKMRPIMEDQSLSREDKMAKMKELRDASNAKIRALLTEEQQKAFDEMQKRRQQRGEGRPGGRGGPGGGRAGQGGPGGGQPPAK